MSLRFVPVPLLLLLVGCATPTTAPPPSIEEASVTVAETTPPVPALSQRAMPGRALSSEQIQRLLSLLDQADQALKERRLTTPAGRNAWFLYSQVLELIPSHQEARDGLRKIADSYINWGYAALRQGQYGAARSYLNRAAMVEPEHPDLDGLRVAIPKRPPPAPRVAKPAPVPEATPQPAESQPTEPQPIEPAPQPLAVIAVADPSQSEFAVDRDQLRRRAPELTARLAGYADLIEARNSRVTIEAPSDADGRWLYQRLNDRREEYRIRANFKLSKQPRIRLLD